MISSISTADVMSDLPSQALGCMLASLDEEQQQLKRPGLSCCYKLQAGSRLDSARHAPGLHLGFRQFEQQREL